MKGSASPPDTRPAGRYRGRSSAWRALQWHCRGQGFDPPRLNQFFKDLADTQLGLLFVGTALLCGGLDMIADVVGGHEQLSCWLVEDDSFRRHTDVLDYAVLLFYQSCLIHRNNETICPFIGPCSLLSPLTC